MTTDRFGSFLQGVGSASRRALEELRRRITALAERVSTNETDIESLEAVLSGVSNIGFGTFSGTTTASGSLTVSHGLSWTPTSVVVQPGTPNGGSINDRFVSANVTSITSTQFVIGRCISQDGSLLDLTAVTGYWAAFR